MRDNPVDALTLVYLARLRDAFGMATETIRPPSAVATVRALREWLAARGGVWATELAPGRAVRIRGQSRPRAAGHAILRPATKSRSFRP